MSASRLAWPVLRVVRSTRMTPVVACGIAGSPVTVPLIAGPDVVPTTVSRSASLLNVAREFSRTVKVICPATAGWGVIVRTRNPTKQAVRDFIQVPPQENELLPETGGQGRPKNRLLILAFTSGVKILLAGISRLPRPLG